MKTIDYAPANNTWDDLYTGAMRGAAAHRATGLRTAEKRRDHNTVPQPLPPFVSADHAHDGFADAFLSLPPAAGRYDPTSASRRRIVAGTMARQEQTAIRACDNATGSRRGIAHGSQLSLSRTGIGHNLADTGETPEEAIERIEETLAVLAALLPVQRQVLAILRGDEPMPLHWSERSWRRWKAYSLDAVRLAIHARLGA